MQKRSKIVDFKQQHTKRQVVVMKVMTWIKSFGNLKAFENIKF